jgi:AcrR family transcriptional regulator
MTRSADESGADAARPGYGEGRTALLEAAIRVVSDRGLRGLTIRSVASEAGVTHGLVRHHFGSRDALIEATLVRSVELAIDSSSLESGSGRVEEIARDLGASVEAQEELLSFQYELLLEARRRPELMAHVRQMYDDFEAATARELERAGLAHESGLAQVLFAALDGLALQQVVFGKRERTEAGVETLHRLLDRLGSPGDGR